MRLATIDVGTNTTLLLVAEVEPGRPPRVLAERAEITRLGRGIGGDGPLGPEGITRTLAVLADYAALAAQHGARLLAIGTEALRRAPNAAQFLGPAAQILGAPVEVIDGQREADLTFRAVVESFPAQAQGPLTVVDIGGGSTEIVLAEGGRVGFRTSLPVGSVRMTERFVHADPATAAMCEPLCATLSAAFTGVPFRPGALLCGVAGTVTTLAAMALNLATYDPARVHGFRLSATTLAAQIARLVSSTEAERKGMPGLDPRRADVILAGALVLRAVVQAAGADEVLVSDRGIRWGLLYEEIGRLTSPDAG